MKIKQLIISFCAVTALSALTVTDANAEAIRVRCEKGTNYSKISIDGRGLVPGNLYKARAISGINKKGTNFRRANVNGERQYDFSSKANDIAAGATAISAGFITGTPPRVRGKIIDNAGFTVATDVVNCTVK